MKVSDVAKASSGHEKFKVAFADGTQLTVTAAQIADFGLFSGREIPDDEFAELVGALEESAARSSALRILGSRNMSSGRVRRKLLEKGTNEPAADKAVKWLEDVGAINDAEHACAIVRHYSSKGYGEARIKDELFRRGIDRELWDEAMACGEGADAAALEYLRKRLRGSADAGELKRAADALCRRGFGYSEARALTSRYIEELEAPDGAEPGDQ